MDAADAHELAGIAIDGEDGRVLLSMLDASTDACWCIEFDEPVDLGAPDREVVRQVFENRPRWRFCNAAMARLYLLPGGERLERRPVREIFPRNAQNEAFVRKLINGGFEMDRAPARDLRYDGVEIDVENDVRAHIVDGRMLRMFGVVRDIGRLRRRERVLEQRLDTAVALLEAMPMPYVAIDAQGIVVGANVAAESLVGRPEASLAGQAFHHALDGVVASDSIDELSRAMVDVTAGSAARSVPITGSFAAQDCTVAWHSACAGGGCLLVFAPIVAGRDATDARAVRTS